MKLDVQAVRVRWCRAEIFKSCTEPGLAGCQVFFFWPVWDITGISLLLNGHKQALWARQAALPLVSVGRGCCTWAAGEEGMDGEGLVINITSKADDLCQLIRTTFLLL